MKIVTVHLPYEIVELVDNLVEAGYFPSRAEALRELIRESAIKFASMVGLK
jgi:Arc/MetJ-type ribon-helix-helix transcriptional regulator